MKIGLLKKITVVVLVGMALTSSAQTLKSARTGGPYTVVETANTEFGSTSTGRVLIYDTYNDYEISKKFQTEKGWIYGLGEASGNINEEKEAYIKDEAQEAAYSQLAGQLARNVAKIHKHVRVTGKRDGMKRNDDTWKDGFMSKLKGELPQASLQFAYKVINGDGNVTYVVGVGIDTKKADLVAKKLMDEDAKVAADAEMDDILNF